ncbi:hypothetical protein PFISCL1PPCAC_7461 [Pristionchus fissidentatus]|uniref:Carboxylic ester hydrolase n=1 Tax=Pristionchus fissidentatus TaxID=1538716 RepID=A0AAV5VE56_9BILA|nr:hypothetical protein PFISCL1PPCAC_7461 [Pristionchus fissidentatus]
MIGFATVFFLLPLIAQSIIVETSRGSVEGFEKDFGSDRTQTFFGYGQVFLGIPYAKAPLGERRYTLTEDICSYTANGEVHNATYYRPRCWQVRDILQPADDMDEDCLYLNVVTPDVKGKFPVMFYIPGGTFTTGGGDVYHWKGTIRNLVSRGVVVVTINYRVGVIGFFTTYTENFPPNRGMFDMIQAMKWTNEEIANFGGDPSRITIFGQSAGASAVSHMSLSPLAQDLFHQTIQTSGAVLLEIETPEPVGGSIHKERAQQICNITDTDWGSAATDVDLMSCLVDATPQELIAYDMKSAKMWNPTLDGSFLPDYPENLAKNRPKYPAIVIDMLEEFASTLPGVSLGDISHTGPYTSGLMMQGYWAHFHKAAAVMTLNDIATTSFAKGVIPADDDHLGWAKLITDIWTGLIFDAFMVRDIKWHQDNGNENIWLFTLTHRSKLPFSLRVDNWIPVAHCADLPFLWVYPDIWETYNYTQADFTVAEHFGTIWTDFAKKGNLAFERAGPLRNYVEIDDVLTARTNWRETADEVYNKVATKIIGEFPQLPMSDASWDMLNALGEKIKSKWNAPKCVAADISTTTQLSSSANVLIAITVCVFARLYE